MPDGTIVENVPDGITQSELLRRYQMSKEQPRTAADDVGAGEAALIGAGRTFDRLAQGAKDLALSVPAYFGSASAKDERAKMAERESENTRLYQQLQDNRPVATFLGEAAPLLAAPVAAGGGLGAAAAASALPGLVEYGTPDERLARGAFGAAGGVAGAVLGKGIARALQPTAGVTDDATRAAIEAAQRIGYKPTAGQQTGSRFLQTMEQQAAKNPIGAATGARSFAQGNQAAINRAALKAIGETGESVTEDSMSAARARLGGLFDSLSANKTIPITPRFEAHVMALKKKTDLAGPFKSPEISNLVDSALELSKSGQMTGEAYQAIRSQLTDHARQAAAASKDKLKSSIKGVVGALDDAAESVLTAEEKTAWKMARKQYAAMKTLEKRGAIKGGDVDPAIIRNALQSGDKGAFARGNLSGELADIARIGNAFRPLPDSGTATNTVAQLLMTGGAGMMGPGALATALAGPALVSKGLFSDAGRRYLTKGLMDVSPELERRLMMGGAGLLGLPAIVGAGQ
jgi:hypothetical protein